jgi:hypothetical protein
VTGAAGTGAGGPAGAAAAGGFADAALAGAAGGPGGAAGDAVLGGSPGSAGDPDDAGRAPRPEADPGAGGGDCTIVASLSFPGSLPDSVAGRGTLGNPPRATGRDSATAG